ncbi:MAG: hypothetical protein ACRC52_17600, partial [Aeromonas veronii]
MLFLVSRKEVLPKAGLGKATRDPAVAGKITGALWRIVHRAPSSLPVGLLQQIDQTLGVTDVVGR